MSYRLALSSEIPVVLREDGYWTLDLWARDLKAQARCVESVKLFCPIVRQSDPGTQLALLPELIEVVDSASSESKLASEIDDIDIVQIPGNFTWRGSRRARLLMQIAHRARKATIVGISSDRARTLIVNSRGQGFIQRLRALAGSLSVSASQRYLVKSCEGAFVVGEGLRRLVEPLNQNVFVGTASWISRSDIVPAVAARRDPLHIRLCIAARLERMKGIGGGLEALAELKRRDETGALSLLIAGAGPQESSLKAQSQSLGLDDAVTFAGTFGYPEPFLGMLRTQDIIVLTNLNDEQPRLVFDAASQGCLIVCPDSLPYRALGLPERLLYRRGDSRALADAITRAIDSVGDVAVRAQLQVVARSATIETMHEHRRDWVNRTLLAAKGRPSGPA